MPTSQIEPSIEQILDLAIASTSMAMLPFTLGAWVTLIWVRSFDDAPHLTSGRNRP
jgi:hypothetical protein